MKPCGQLKILQSEITNKQPITHSVFYITIFVDETGNRFVARDAKFLFDLTPIDDPNLDITGNNVHANNNLETVKLVNRLDKKRRR